MVSIATDREHLRWNDLLRETSAGREDLPARFPGCRLRIIARTDNLAADRQPHDHDFFEIVIVRRGTALHNSPYGERRIRRGDVVIVPPGVWHGYAECRDLEVGNCCVGREVFLQHLPILARDEFWRDFIAGGGAAAHPQWHSPFRLGPEQYRPVDERFGDLERLSRSPFAAGTNLRLLSTLLAQLESLSSALPRPSVRRATDKPVHPLVRRSIAMVEGEPAFDWRLSDLCRRLGGVNESYFIRVFKRHTGTTPKAYITRLRLNEAAGRLASTSDSVTEIAIALGWSDPNLFSKTFRQHFDACPTEYRLAAPRQTASGT